MRWQRPSTERGVRTRYRIDARLHDGALYWRGWFDDRDNVNAFLWALMRHEPMPREIAPTWHPGLLELPLTYYFSTTTFLTTTGSLQTFNVPADWNSSNNSIYTIGGGGGAADGNSGVLVGGGGGGAGALSLIFNLTLTPSGTASYQIGSGGAHSAVATNAGGDSWFNGATLGASSCGAKGGGAPVRSDTGAQSTGGKGGQQVGNTGGVGTLKNLGGNGGNGGFGTGGDGGGGGGGAAGPSTDGSNGVSPGNGTNEGGAGGAAGLTSGGAGGASGTIGSPWPTRRQWHFL